jgi:hypothetical protein
MKYQQPLYARLLQVVSAIAIFILLIAFIRTRYAVSAITIFTFLLGLCLQLWTLRLVYDSLSSLEIIDNVVIIKKPFSKLIIERKDVERIEFRKTNQLMNACQGYVISIEWKGKISSVNIYKYQNDINNALISKSP